MVTTTREPATLRKTPAGNYDFVGNVPSELAFVQSGGSPATADQLEKIKISGPGFVKEIKPRSWPTATAAAKAARELNVDFKDPRALEPELPRKKPAPTYGASTAATGPDGSTNFHFRFRIVELEDLITSHNLQLEKVSEFPAELQERIRDRQKSLAQIDKIGSQLNPDAILTDTHRLSSGPMIIGPDLIVEAGNGRTLGLRKAWADYPRNAANYRSELASRAEALGFDPQIVVADTSPLAQHPAVGIEGFIMPVLVRERTSNLEQMGITRAKFAALSNEAEVLQMSPLEQAIRDAGRISDDPLTRLEITSTEGIDLALRNRRNAPIVGQFLTGITDNERAAMATKDGSLNQLGLQRLKAAIFAKVFPGESGQRLAETFFESIEPTVKNAEGAIFDALPKIAQAEGLVRTGQRSAELSIGADISKSVDMFARLKQEGIAISDFVGQGGFFERELTNEQEQILIYMNEGGRSRKRMRELMTGYAEAVTSSPHPNQTSLFENITETKSDILARLIGAQEREASGQDIGLFGLLEAREQAAEFGGLEPVIAATGAPFETGGVELAESGQRERTTPEPKVDVAPEESRRRVAEIVKVQVNGKLADWWVEPNDEPGIEKRKYYSEQDAKDGITRQRIRHRFENTATEDLPPEPSRGKTFNKTEWSEIRQPGLIRELPAVLEAKANAERVKANIIGYLQAAAEKNQTTPENMYFRLFDRNHSRPIDYLKFIEGDVRNFWDRTNTDQFQAAEKDIKRDRATWRKFYELLKDNIATHVENLELMDVAGLYDPEADPDDIAVLFKGSYSLENILAELHGLNFADHWERGVDAPIKIPSFYDVREGKAKPSEVLAARKAQFDANQARSRAWEIDYLAEIHKVAGALADHFRQDKPSLRLNVLNNILNRAYGSANSKTSFRTHFRRHISNASPSIILELYKESGDRESSVGRTFIEHDDIDYNNDAKDAALRLIPHWLGHALRIEDPHEPWKRIVSDRAMRDVMSGRAPWGAFPDDQAPMPASMSPAPTEADKKRDKYDRWLAAIKAKDLGQRDITTIKKAVAALGKDLGKDGQTVFDDLIAAGVSKESARDMMRGPYPEFRSKKRPSVTGGKPRKVKPVQCQGCNQTFDHDPAEDVDCPSCQAKAGQSCVRPSEHKAMRLHIKRDEKALREGVIKPCPGQPDPTTPKKGEPITSGQALHRFMEVKQGTRKGQKKRSPPLDVKRQAETVADPKDTSKKGIRIQWQWWSHPNIIDFSGVDEPQGQKVS